MTKELARYFFTLIDKDLYFSFDGMGLPNSACEWLENQLIQENFDKVEEFIKLRYTEQSEKAIKKKHKFRAKTIREHCSIEECKKCEYLYGTIYCLYSVFNGIHKEREDSKPYKKRNGKYILIEVKE
nr:MAG TPA: hypothetical protein [Caudoviricetes sp.]